MTWLCYLSCKFDPMKEKKKKDDDDNLCSLLVSASCKARFMHCWTTYHVNVICFIVFEFDLMKMTTSFCVMHFQTTLQTKRVLWCQSGKKNFNFTSNLSFTHFQHCFFPLNSNECLWYWHHRTMSILEKTRFSNVTTALFANEFSHFFLLI